MEKPLSWSVFHHVDLSLIAWDMSRFKKRKRKKGRRQKMSNILKSLKKVDGKKTGIFAAGVLFGTAGIKVLSSKDAKKLYTNCTAAVLRAKDCVMKVVTTVQENAEDIYAEAQQINEEREAKAAVVEDEETEETKETEETAEDFTEE